MATLLDEVQTQTIAVDTAAKLHNAQINERYRRLQNAEADQFATPTQQTYEPVLSLEPTVLPVETPAVEQAPQVTEYVRSYAESPLFTTEKFDRVEELIQEETPVTAVKVVENTAVAQEAQYSLTHIAKVVMAAFATLVMIMLTLICVNSHVISRNEVEIQALELQREQLIEENAEIRALIENAQSDEVIREFAVQNGMIAG
jgi:cell division protein FtsL